MVRSSLKGSFVCFFFPKVYTIMKDISIFYSLLFLLVMCYLRFRSFLFASLFDFRHHGTFTEDLHRRPSPKMFSVPFAKFAKV